MPRFSKTCAAAPIHLTPADWQPAPAGAFNPTARVVLTVLQSFPMDPPAPAMLCEESVESAGGNARVVGGRDQLWRLESFTELGQRQRSTVTPCRSRSCSYLVKSIANAIATSTNPPGEVTFRKWCISNRGRGVVSEWICTS